MATKILHPESEAAWKALRALDVTSTESPALLGLSPYATEFDLYHRKRDKVIVELPENERMALGSALQDPVARHIADKFGWKARRLSAYMRDEEIRMGASFDFEIVSHADGPGILEIKCVDYIVFRDQWLYDKETKEVEAPEHIELQVQHQLEVSDREWAVIGVLVGGNRIVTVPRRRDREVGQVLRRKIVEFWKRVDAGTPPTPDFARDAAAIAKVYGYAEPGKIFDARGDAKIATLLSRYNTAAKAEKEAKEDKDAAKAELLTLIGDAEKVIADGFRVSCGLVAPAEVPAYTRAGFRGWRVTPAKAPAPATAAA